MSEFKLIEEIIARSEAATWDEAKLEWQLAEVYYVQEPETCLCGQFPINEVCVLLNTRNGGTTDVGNVCVKNFMGLASDKIFVGLRRITKDIDKAINAEAAAHAHDKGWINDWERGFCFDTMRKRKLSEKQMAKRRQINRKVIRHTLR